MLTSRTKRILLLVLLALRDRKATLRVKTDWVEISARGLLPVLGTVMVLAVFVWVLVGRI